MDAVCVLWMSLPVWRELKPQSASHAVAWECIQSGLNEPSRLKGIETKSDPGTTFSKYAWHIELWMSLPVWRELKHDTRKNISGATVLSGKSLNEPSRLKGIETLNWQPCTLTGCLGFISSEWAFPFEGNWNLLSLYICMSSPNLHDPLNEPSRLKGMETQCECSSCFSFRIRLNVPSRFEGNGNASPTTTPLRVKVDRSECAFPFEGNGNIAILQSCRLAGLNICSCVPRLNARNGNLNPPHARHITRTGKPHSRNSFNPDNPDPNNCAFFLAVIHFPNQFWTVTQLPSPHHSTRIKDWHWRPTMLFFW